MGNDPKQGEDFVKVPTPRDLPDDVEGHAREGNPKPGEGFVKVPTPRESDGFVKVPTPRETDDLEG
jgi:hypothetical protein